MTALIAWTRWSRRSSSSGLDETMEARESRGGLAIVETERRTTGRRLEGLRRRYDRDLLALADRIAIGSKK